MAPTNLTKDRLFTFLDSKLSMQKQVTSWQNGTQDHLFPYWVVAEALTPRGITTYCDEISDVICKQLVETLRSIYLKNSRNFASRDEVSYVYCFNLLQLAGWDLDWGTNIFGAWINEEGSSVTLENSDMEDWGFVEEGITITREILGWMLEWLDSSLEITSDPLLQDL